MEKEIERHVSILGQRITLVRPSRIPKSILMKKDRPQAKYDERPKTRVLGVCEFMKLCMEFNEPVEEPKPWRR